MPRVLPATPGKLMIAGEYAVLRDGGACLSVAVGQLVRAQLAQASAEPTLHLTAFGQTVSLQRPWLPASGLGGFAVAALTCLERRHGVTPHHDLHLEAQGAVGGAKVGLGTSAAVTIATLRAVLASAEQRWTADEVAACARTIHQQVQGERGSGYDVTTIAMGGTIAYRRSPDRAEALTWPNQLCGAALFSGQPAPTAATLARGDIADEALGAIAAAATDLLAIWPQADARRLLQAIGTCEAAFALATRSAPWLWTPHLTALHRTIEGAGCVARTSGAGAGDCVLAFADDPARIERVVADWQASGGVAVARLPADVAPRA